jgi:hypothetical protein
LRTKLYNILNQHKPTYSKRKNKQKSKHTNNLLTSCGYSAAGKESRPNLRPRRHPTRSRLDARACDQLARERKVYKVLKKTKKNILKKKVKLKSKMKINNETSATLQIIY